MNKRSNELMSDLSVYALPGRITDASVGIQEAIDAENAGFGAVYISERLDLKEAGSVCGALVASTKNIKVGTAIIHQGTRHPLTMASMAATLQQMSNGRFVLGVGRGLAALAPSLGIEKPTLAGLEQMVITLKDLWAGKKITHHEARGYRFTDHLSVPPPPILFGTMGPLGQSLAGRIFDGVILHPFLTVESVEKSVKIVRQAAEEAGRDPSKVRVVSTLIAGPDMSSERFDVAVKARGISYFQVKGLGEQIATLNGWDLDVLEKLRNHPTLAGKGIADTALTRDKLVESAEVIPDEWFLEGGAVGSSERCVERIKAYRNVGVDEILIHGASPAEATRMASLWRKEQALLT